MSSPDFLSRLSEGCSRAALTCVRACAALSCVALQEGEQIGVQLVLVRVGKPVRGTRVDHELRVLDQLRGAEGGSSDGNDLVIVTMKDEGRHVELLQILGEV